MALKKRIKISVAALLSLVIGACSLQRDVVRTQKVAIGKPVETVLSNRTSRLVSNELTANDEESLLVIKVSDSHFVTKRYSTLIQEETTVRYSRNEYQSDNILYGGLALAILGGIVIANGARGATPSSTAYPVGIGLVLGGGGAAGNAAYGRASEGEGKEIGAKSQETINRESEDSVRPASGLNVTVETPFGMMTGRTDSAGVATFSIPTPLATLALYEPSAKVVVGDDEPSSVTVREKEVAVAKAHFLESFYVALDAKALDAFSKQYPQKSGFQFLMASSLDNSRQLALEYSTFHLLMKTGEDWIQKAEFSEAYTALSKARKYAHTAELRGRVERRIDTVMAGLILSKKELREVEAMLDYSEAVRNFPVSASVGNVLTNPTASKGRIVSFNAKVEQNLEDGVMVSFGDSLIFIETVKSANLLTDRYVEVLGVIEGTFQYRTLLGSGRTVPRVSAIAVRQMY